MSEDKNMPDLKELYGEFIEECKELIEGMARELVDLEKNPSDEELINKIFRSAHSMKGNAGFIGLTNLSELAHKMENVLGKLRDKEFPFFAEINDILFKGLDIARGILSDFIEGRSRDWDLKSIYSDLEGLLSGPSKEEVVAASYAASSAAQGAAATLRLTAEEKNKKRKGGEEESASYMRVSTSRLDKLVNLVGELAAGRSRLSQLSKEARNKPLEEVASFIASISSQIQSEVLSIRMVPIKQLFNKFYRLVRDVSRPMGKDVELQVVGEETELDKTIIELLHDPILHMVRNAVGHGIETPEERKRLGKPQAGTVILRAYHEQNYVYVDVEDDGRGLNPDRIRKKALEKGIIGADEASAMSDDEAVRLIFLSGFSTAEEIDDISGRGVGMNVVKTNIEKVGGSIDVDYREGAGTRFILKMPLTLAIVQLFLLRDGGRYYGIPLGYVDETIRIKASEVEFIKGQRVYMLRHHPVPIVDLSDVLGIKAEKAPDEIFSIVVVRLFQKRIGFIVEGFLGKVETVIKPLGKYIDRLPEAVEGISGAAILGTGEIVLVLDIPALGKSM